MKRITIEEFRNLPDHEQYEILTTAGHFVELRYEDRCKWELYSLDHFFVEVQYDLLQSIIISIRSFDSGQSLDKYSSALNSLLTGLFHS